MNEVNKVLVRALATLLIAIDLSDDEEIDPDVANKITEPIVGLFRDVAASQRAEIAHMITECAALEVTEERREAILELPATMGLLDD
jgi:hypothetical protein